MKETSSIEKIVEDVKQAFILTEQKAQNEQDKDKKEMYNKIISKVKFVLDKFDKAPNKDEQLKKEILSASNEVLSTWLDKLKGKDVTDNSIFKTLPRHFEDEFHKDMAALNVILFQIILIIFYLNCKQFKSLKILKILKIFKKIQNYLNH